MQSRLDDTARVLKKVGKTRSPRTSDCSDHDGRPLPARSATAGAAHRLFVSKEMTYLLHT